MGIIWWSGGITFSVKKSKYSAQEGNSCVPDHKGVHLSESGSRGKIRVEYLRIGKGRVC